MAPKPKLSRLRERLPLIKALRSSFIVQTAAFVTRIATEKIRFLLEIENTNESFLRRRSPHDQAKSMDLTGGNNINVDDLNRIPLFAQVSSAALRVVTPNMVKHFRNGKYIFRLGDEENHLVLLLEGQACVYRGE